MQNRSFSRLDQLFGEIDKAIKVLTVPDHASRDSPAVQQEETLSEPMRRESARLMRVNHSGEVAAQALYRGQALTARRPDVASAMRKAAAEEADHLAWCDARLRELKGRTSLLNPLWYLGSFAIGALAGTLGDGASLGFVAETERQVESHLRSHVEQLGAADPRSRAILEQMRHDEIQHGAEAAALGAKELPFPVGLVMGITARLMTRGSYWV
jgi:ubiquinone biosynthesis monooxygenase Coq7